MNVPQREEAPAPNKRNTIIKQKININIKRKVTNALGKVELKNPLTKTKFKIT